MPFGFPSNDFRENDADIASVELVKPFQDSIVELSLETVKDGGIDRDREDRSVVSRGWWKLAELA